MASRIMTHDDCGNPDWSETEGKHSNFPKSDSEYLREMVLPFLSPNELSFL